MSEKKENPRAEIDAIDDELLKLLNERAAIALRVGEVKRRNDTSLCDPNREFEVLSRLSAQNSGPLDEQSVTSIFQRIIDECLHVQQRAFHPATIESTQVNAKMFGGKERVAFLGERGTFSEEACLKLLGDECETVARPTFESLFSAIDEKSADFILAPLENSLVGLVHRCHDLLLEKSSLGIAAEIVLPIAHFLISCHGATLETIEIVESHPVALAQCTRFFAEHPHIKRVATDDTASGVRRVVESGDTTRAAIAGKRAAHIYDGSILKEHLEDHAENYTRFVLLAQNLEIDEQQGGKISLVVRLAHRPGALHDALRPFVRRGIDLLKIESRPIKDSPWQYNFYLDLQAPKSESELRGALDEIREQADEVRILGRYATVEIPNDR
jgi:chorismate mutase-like protein